MRDTSPMNSDRANTADARAVTRHDDRGRYELRIDGDVVSFAVFSERDGTVTIPHIETDVRHRGNGYAAMLMDGVIDDLRTRTVLVRATCPVAHAHLVSHAPELLVL